MKRMINSLKRQVFHVKQKIKGLLPCGDAASVGIIGSTDGPTSIFVTKVRRNDKKSQEYRRLLQRAAASIKPCGHDFAGLPAYLREHYGAVEYPLNERRLDMLKACVIMNHFPHLLKKPEPLGEKPSKKEVIRYCEQDTSWEQARNYPAEKLGLDLRSYLLPHEQPDPLDFPPAKTGPFKKKAPVPDLRKGDRKVIVELEMTTKYLTIQNGSRALMDDLILWHGVTQQDIDGQTPRFIGYVHTLKEMGRL